MSTIHVLIEPACANAALYLQSIAGLQKGAVQQRKKIKFYQSAQEMLSVNDANIAVIVSANLDWTQCAAQQLRSEGFKMILVGAALEVLGEDFSGPTLNRPDLVKRLLEYFISAGRTRIACLGNQTQDINDQIRINAFLNYGKSLGLSVSAHDVYDSDEGLHLCIERFLDKAGRYNGAICVNDMVAIELLAQAKQRGIKVPEELFVAGSGDFRMGHMMTPSLTTTTLDYFKMGLLATDIWQMMNKYSEADRVKVSLPCELIIRQSTDGFHPALNLSDKPDAQAGKAELTQDTTVDFLRKLENCLLTCDPLDIKILSAMYSNESISAMAERLFVSIGTINYRLKQLYASTGIGQKNELTQQLHKYISSSAALEQMANACVENNIKLVYHNG